MHFVSRDIPVGSIQSWSGSIVDIPSTFRLCDGTHGTPDLRNKFVVGSGDTYTPNQIGGSLNQIHDFTAFEHEHDIGAGGALLGGGGYDPETTTREVTGTTDTTDIRPPYYSLAYIMYAGRTL